MLLILQKLLEIEPTFVTGRHRIRRKKRQFDYEAPDEVIQDPEEKFKVEFYYAVLDKAKNSIEERFQQLEQYNTIFGFLYDIHGIKETCTDLLKGPSKKLHVGRKRKSVAKGGSNTPVSYFSVRLSHIQVKISFRVGLH